VVGTSRGGDYAILICKRGGRPNDKRPRFYKQVITLRPHVEQLRSDSPIARIGEPGGT
jgi:hypothetical protein